VDYSRGAKGLITGVTTTTATGTEILASNADYLPFGPMNALEYGNGVSLAANYDLDYRLTQLNHSGLRDSQYNYDGVDNITDISNTLNGNEDQSFAYDALNRLGYASGNYGGISYGYDENGNRVSYTDSTGVDSYTYDSSSHRLLSTNNWVYQYDNNGNRIAKLNSDGSGAGVVYHYDDNNRMVEVVKHEIAQNGDPIDTLLANYTYNANGQRVRKTTSEQTMHYIYSRDGQLLAEVDNNGDTHREYFYLNRQPLAAAHYTYIRGPETSGPETFMDDGSSGTSSTGFWANTRKKKNAYNDFYSLSNNTGSTYRFTPPNLKDANYDIYAWWPRSRKNNPATEFTIAHNGKTSTNIQNQSRAGKQWKLLGTYHFSGTGAEYIEISDLGGKTAADGIRLVEKIPAPPPTAIINLYYIHNDHLGTPQVFTDQSQTVVWHANYKPFGEVTVSIGSIVTGLHQNYFRDYDPEVGRYVQSDPIGLRGGANSFAYVSANPLSYIDPEGTFFFLVPLAFSFGGAVSGSALEYFYQVIIEGKSNECVDVGDVLIAGAIGAVVPGGSTVLTPLKSAYSFYKKYSKGIGTYKKTYRSGRKATQSTKQEAIRQLKKAAAGAGAIGVFEGAGYAASKTLNYTPVND